MSCPGCAGRPCEGGRAASEVANHARPLAARCGAGGTRRRERAAKRTKGPSKDVSKGLSIGMLHSNVLLIFWANDSVGKKRGRHDNED